MERLVRYVKDNFFPGRKFENLEDLNRQAIQWCRQADSKPHSTTGKIPLQEVMQEPLMPLPEQIIMDRYRWETRKVTREGLVSFDGIRYGVPWQYSGKEVQVRLHNETVEIYYGEVMLAKHPAKHGGNRIIYLRGQYKGLTEKKGMALPSRIAYLQESQVEQRELSFYDQFLEDVKYG